MNGVTKNSKCLLLYLCQSTHVKNCFGGNVISHRIFPLSHFSEKHKRQSLRATLQKGDQEAGFGACWRSYPVLQAYTALQRLPPLCGLSGYDPSSKCADWPCSEWTPMVPCSNKIEEYLLLYEINGINILWFYILVLEKRKCRIFLEGNGSCKDRFISVMVGVFCGYISTV